MSQHVNGRLRPSVPAFAVGRTAGTIVALSGVVVAGGASTGSAGDEDASGSATAAFGLPANRGEDVRAQRTARAAELPEASRDQIRSSFAEMRDHAELPSTARSGSQTAQADSLIPEDPRGIARMLMADYGWGTSQFSCLDQLYISESNWEVDAENPSSGAYGIPQSLPAEKMATAGADWRTNPMTQLEWGLGYIEESYGTPCSAWEFKQANNWY